MAKCCMVNESIRGADAFIIQLTLRAFRRHADGAFDFVRCPERASLARRIVPIYRLRASG